MEVVTLAAGERERAIKERKRGQQQQQQQRQPLSAGLEWKSAGAAVCLSTWNRSPPASVRAGPQLLGLLRRSLNVKVCNFESVITPVSCWLRHHDFEFTLRSSAGINQEALKADPGSVPSIRRSDFENQPQATTDSPISDCIY